MLFKQLDEEHGMTWLKNTLKENALKLLVDEVLEIENQILFLDVVIEQFQQSMEDIISTLETKEDMEQWEEIKSSITRSINHENAEKNALTEELFKKKEQMNKIILNNITPLR